MLAEANRASFKVPDEGLETSSGYKSSQNYDRNIPPTTTSDIIQKYLKSLDFADCKKDVLQRCPFTIAPNHDDYSKRGTEDGVISETNRAISVSDEIMELICSNRVESAQKGRMSASFDNKHEKSRGDYEEYLTHREYSPRRQVFTENDISNKTDESVEKSAANVALNSVRFAIESNERVLDASVPIPKAKILEDQRNIESGSLSFDEQQTTNNDLQNFYAKNGRKPYKGNADDDEQSLINEKPPKELNEAMENENVNALVGNETLIGDHSKSQQNLQQDATKIMEEQRELKEKWNDERNQQKKDDDEKESSLQQTVVEREQSGTSEHKESSSPQKRETYDKNMQRNGEHVDKTNYEFNRSYQNGQTHQYYDERGQACQQYDESGQLLQRSDESIDLLQQGGENGELLQECGEKGSLVQEEAQSQQCYDENGQPIQQYLENGQTVQRYDESDQGLRQYDGNSQLEQYYDEDGQPIQQYDENGQPIQQYDENGQPIQQYDEHGQMLRSYDGRESDQPLQQQYGESGESQGNYYNSNEPLQQYGESGYPQEQYDENGQPLQQYDENGSQQYQGYETYGQEGQGVYDENGQLIQHFDEYGQPLHYDENGQLIQQTYDEQDLQYYGYDESGQPLQNYQQEMAEGETCNSNMYLADDAQDENKNSGDVQASLEQQDISEEQYAEDPQQQQTIEDGVSIGLSHKEETESLSKEKEEVKQAMVDEHEKAETDPNLAIEGDTKHHKVMEMLDTDTESSRQDTKASHDSDFDFSATSQK